MPTYIGVPFEEDPDNIVRLVIAYIQAVLPGWVPAAGNLETILIEANARYAAEVARLASTATTDIFRWYGPLVGVFPIDASPAVAETTWTMRDDAGYTIPANTLVGLRAAGDQLVAFRTLNPVIVPAGQTMTAAGGVTVVAVDPGAAGSGLGGTGVLLELIDPLDFVLTAAMVDITTGGDDAEQDADYLDRLRTELQLLSPRPILPRDFAALAREIPGVERAVALDGYNPADSTYLNERMVTVVAVDEVGQPITTLAKTQVDALLQAMREVNFVVNVIDATYTTVDATTGFTIVEGYTGSDVKARVEAAVTDYLRPSNWGRPTSGDQHVWIDQPVVRYLEVAQVVNQVAGVDYITSILLGGGAHKTYAVVASTDVFTVTGHGYANGDPILVVAATAGAPLTVGAVYFVRDVTTNTFKVTLTAGGAAVNVTSDGSGSVQKVGTADVALAGPAGLPQPGVIVGTAA